MIEFGLSTKLRHVITDNASNMKKAFTTCFLAGDEAEEDVAFTDDDELWFDHESARDAITEEAVGSSRHLSCFAHTLQLAVRDGLKETRSLYSALSKCSKLASLLHSSTKFQEQFEGKFGDRKGIPQVNDTRWNSTLIHVKGVLKLSREMLSELLCSPRVQQENLLLTAREWSQLQELVMILEPFLEATNYTQGEKVLPS